MITFLFFLSGFVILFWGIGTVQEANKIESRYLQLMAKFNHAEIASRIIENQLWIGQTSEQLIEMRGEAIAKTSEMKRNMTKVEIWKYGQTGKNRFNVKVTLENDRVVSWVE